MANPSTIARRLESAPVKLNKWNAQEVRVALDDLVARYFVEEAQYTEVKTLLYKKLAFALALTIVGGITGLYARFTPFSEAKVLTALGAGCYMLLLGYYTVWLSYCIIPTCFRGLQPGTQRLIWVSSNLELPSAMYRLTLLSPTTGTPSKVSCSWPIGELIQDDGVVSGEAFCAALSKFVSLDTFKAFLKTE